MTGTVWAAVLAVGLGISFSAHAGLWVEVQSERPDMETIAYQSDKMGPGEVLMARGGLREMSELQSFDGVTALTRTRSEIHLVFTHTEPFIGFDGISLRRERESEDILVLYNPASGDRTAQECGYGWGSGLKCMHACFRTYEDLRGGGAPVDCASGLGRWIFVAMQLGLYERSRSTLSQKEAEFYEVRGWPWLDQPQDLADSNFLIVKAKSKGTTHFNVPIDDVFRKVLWNPGK